MSEKKVDTTNKVEPGDELVEYTAQLLPGDAKQEIVVGVNGNLIRIQRGETVKVKRKYVEVIKNAERQRLEAHKGSAAAQKAQKLYDL